MTSTVTFHVGDVRDRIAAMSDSSVDLIVTSPPFLALRSYLPADHPDKHREIGNEPTPATFLDTLLELTAEWRRLLTPTGSLCVELGDTYSGSGESGWERDKGEYRRENRSRPSADGQLQQMRDTASGWPLAKSLCCIPALYETALAYGINPLTGAPSPAGKWRVRNLLVWTRPNPPVGQLGDKLRPATSYVTVACTSDRRWFDLDAVRQPYLHPNHSQVGNPTSYRAGLSGEAYGEDGQGIGRIRTEHPAGAPPLDWHHDDWQPLHRMPTAPYPGAHYATYPLALPRKLIEAMCPREVCTVCGEARRRIVERLNPLGLDNHKVKARATAGVTNGALPMQGRAGTLSAPVHDPERITLGWSDCGHNNYRPGHVLDPFAGSGTTLLAAALCGRDATGIDIDWRNGDLTLQRLRDAAHVTGIANDPYHFIWSVDPELPGIKGEHPDQLSLFEAGL